MRIALYITAAALLLMTYFWLDSPIDSSEPPDQARPAPTQAAPKVSRPFPSLSALLPANDSPSGVNNPTPQPPEHTLPAPQAPTANRLPSLPALPFPADPRWQEIAANPTQPETKSVYIGIVDPQAERIKSKRDDWKYGSVTLQGGYSYYPIYSAAPNAISRVTITATMDCQSAGGVLYFRDIEQRVEWLSSKFPFDAKTLCVTKQEQLDALTAGFNLDITESYAPLTTPLINDDLGMLQDGQFNLSFISNEASNTSQSAIKICLVLQGGSYAYYQLPPNRRTPSAMPQCAFLDNFTLQRNLQ